MLGFYYTFDRAIYSIILNLVIFIIYFLKNDKKDYLLYIASYLLGFIFPLIIILLFFGIDIIYLIFSNILLLVTEGKYCCIGEFMNYSHGSGNLPLIKTGLRKYEFIKVCE